ncbi:MAG TPA: TIGR00725 family protein [Firmicutes bacterium]|nr:TIGR00725 family protein [Bacillota bacterium]
MAGRVIGVIGGSSVNRGIYEKARQAGRLIAERGAVVICGGLGGVMEAACRGAKEAGGITVGILPGKEKSAANKYVDIAVATGMNEARNAVIVNSADAFIAVDGKYGTMSEIAFALKKGKPIAGIDTFDMKEIIKTKGPEEAVKKIFAVLGNKK